jgi:hypothetical protein
MARGRSIRIYLDGGEVSGIKHAELVNWTGQALLCPRNRLSELAARWQHVVSRPGVYFLLGAEQGSAREVYVGEAEDVLERLKEHLAKKDFWQEALVFTSKDENLTKSHVKYAESRLVDRAKTARRYVVQNEKNPPLSGLPRADQDAMEEFLDQVPLLMGVLGHRVLDPIASASTIAAAEDRLSYAPKDAQAFGAVTDDGFVVFKGSTALKGTTSTMTPGWVAFKEELIAGDKLRDAGSLLVFAEDVLFSSASAAAAIVCANNANGRAMWKSQDGRTLKQIEESESS